jgi:hypothetical protein
MAARRYLRFRALYLQESHALHVLVTATKPYNLATYFQQFFH